MEPFELSLTQVSFHSKDSTFEQQSVNSFGNLVSYDCDLSTGTEETSPVKSRTVIQESGDNHKKGEGISDLIRTNGAISYQQNSLVVPWDIELPSEQEEHHYREDSGTFDSFLSPDTRIDTRKPLSNEIQKITPTSMSANSSTSDTHAANNTAVFGTSSANQKPHSVKAPDVMSDDSFHAFTHTVDALALQQSSIGSSNITPASADEIARVIAATAQQLNIKPSSTLGLVNDTAKQVISNAETSDTESLNQITNGHTDLQVSNNGCDIDDLYATNSANSTGDNAHVNSDSAELNPGVNKETVENSKIESVKVPEQKVLKESAEIQKSESVKRKKKDRKVTQNTAKVTSTGKNRTITAKATLLERKPVSLPPKEITIQDSDEDIMENSIPPNTIENSSSFESSSKPGNNTHVTVAEESFITSDENSTSIKDNYSPTREISTPKKENATPMRDSSTPRKTSPNSATNVKTMTNTSPAKDHEPLKDKQNGPDGLPVPEIYTAKDLDKLKQNSKRLEQVVITAQRLMEDKDTEINIIQEELSSVRELSHKTQQRVVGLQSEVESRDSAIIALKNKVAELYVDYQTSNQGLMIAENDVKSLTNERDSADSSKLWYQERCRQLQLAKSHLQQQVTELQTDNISKTTMLERQKAENVRVKQQLTDVERKVIQEKELLAQHLEAIESDMMERDSAFSLLQRDRANMEAQLQESSEMTETITLNGTAMTAVDVEQDMRRHKNTQTRMQAQIRVLQHEQNELVRRLTLSQESILQRDKSLDDLEQRFVDMEVNLTKLRGESETTADEIMTLKHQKESLEKQVGSFDQERRKYLSEVMNLVVDSEQENIQQSYTQMKQELNMAQQRRREQASQSAVVNGVHDSAEQTESIQGAGTDGSHGNAASDGGHTDASDGSTHGNGSVADVGMLEEYRTLMEKLHGHVSGMGQTGERQAKAGGGFNVDSGVNAKSSSSPTDVVMNESFVSSLMLAYISLQRELQQVYVEQSARGKRNNEILGSLEGMKVELVTAKEQLEAAEEERIQQAATPLPAPVCNHSELLNDMERLRSERNSLEDQLGTVQRETHRDIAKHKVKVLRLTKDLEQAMRDKREAVEESKMEVIRITKKLAEAEKDCYHSNQQLETTRAELLLQADERHVAMEDKCEAITKERDDAFLSETKLHKKVEELTTTLEALKLGLANQNTDESLRVTNQNNAEEKVLSTKHINDEIQRSTNEREKERAVSTNHISDELIRSTNQITNEKLVDMERSKEMLQTRISELEVTNQDLSAHCKELEKELEIRMATQSASEETSQVSTAKRKSSEIQTDVPDAVPVPVSTVRSDEAVQVEHTEALQDVIRELSEIRTSHKEAEQKNLTLTEEYAELKITHDELSRAHLLLTWNHDELERLVNQQKKSDERTELTKLTAEYNELVDTHEQLADTHELLSTNHEELSSKFEELNGNYSQLSQAHQDLSHTHIDLCTTRDDLVKLQARAEQNFDEVCASRDEAVQLLRQEQDVVKELHERVADLEAALAAEKLKVKDSKKQLLTERGRLVKLRRRFETETGDSEQHSLILERLQSELETAQRELADRCASHDALVQRADNATADLRDSMLESNKLKNELHEYEIREPIQEDHVQTLEWQVQHSERKLSALDEQMSIAEQTHKEQLENLQTNMEVTVSELSGLKADLADIKQERANLQGQVSELKVALQSSVDHNRVLESSVEGSPAKGDVTNKHRPLYNMDEITSLLKKTEKSTPIDSKVSQHIASPLPRPLSFLQATLNGLRGEIVTLQTQVSKHSTTVQSSSDMWKELEEQVTDLREVCRSSAADREALPPMMSSEESNELMRQVAAVTNSSL